MLGAGVFRSEGERLGKKVLSAADLHGDRFLQPALGGLPLADGVARSHDRGEGAVIVFRLGPFPRPSVAAVGGDVEGQPPGAQACAREEQQ